MHRFIRKLLTQHVKKGKSLAWLGEEFQKLVVLRNSDFDTDELDDEELERLGGLE